MENRSVHFLLKILILGVVTTIFRICCQLLLPESNQTILKPSIFVTSKTLPIAFSILAVISYSIFAYLFILMVADKRVETSKKNQGLKYSLSLCFLWSTYLFEPLPHAVSILQDSIAYVIVDSLALLVMGLGLDFFFKSKTNPKGTGAWIKTIDGLLSSLIVPTVFFLLGRLCLYNIFGIYSYFEERSLVTILWCLVTGAISSSVVLYLTSFVQNRKNSRNPLFIGITVYAINLFFFNSFMLIVFDFNPLDLLLRTFIDILAISSGLLISEKLKEISNDRK
ncbi:hypothetical protein [Candidatus Enterococcus murrayae]|uniref:Uncharacterized protein n=1 Tax=Candidatus Enterococcus murrayae TaxID=2815321 RepID=A0ABS3HMG7_9ENTE|nr:hypothetical protein [Enterococcus sp. MJM16]MBO0454647.1 hypothetical protein [Enterococcus sp. MJM16]